MYQPNLYDVLGVRRNATAEEINKAYRKKAFDLHPDRQKEADRAEAEERIKLLNVARGTLVDALSRRDYDLSLLDNRAGATHAWFCPVCPDRVRVFVSQHAWRCNVCGLTGSLFNVRAFIGGDVQSDPYAPSQIPASRAVEQRK